MTARTFQPHEIHLLDGREADAWFKLASEEEILAALQHKARYLAALLDEDAIDNEEFCNWLLISQGIL